MQSMKSRLTVPEVGQQENFNREGKDAYKSKKAQAFFMLFSAVTVAAAWIIYLRDVFSWLNVVAAVCLGVCLLLFFTRPIEKTIKDKASYLSKFWLNRKSYTEEEMTSLRVSVMINATILGLLMVYSGVFSFVSTKTTLKISSHQVEEFDTKQYEADRNSRVRNIEGEYRTAVNDINKRYNALIEGIRSEYNGEIASLEADIQYYQERQSRTGTVYETYIRNRKVSIGEQETERDTRVSEEERKKAAELAAVASTRTTGIQAADVAYDNAVALGRSLWEEEFTESGFLAKSFSWIVAVFALVCVLLYVVLEYHIQGILYRCGIEEKVELSSEFFWQESAFDRAMKLPGKAAKRLLGQFTHWAEGILPDPKHPRFERFIDDPRTIRQHVRAVRDVSLDGVELTNTVVLPNGSISPSPVEEREPVGSFSLKETNLGEGQDGSATKNGSGTPKKTPPKKESKPKTNGVHPTSPKPKQLSSELDERISRCFHNPLPFSHFYKLVGKHPDDYSQYSDYLKDLKKNLNNRHIAMNRVNSTDLTRSYNSKRYEATKLELGRMAVRVVERSGEGPLCKDYINDPTLHRQHAEMAYKYAEQLEG